MCHKVSSVYCRSGDHVTVLVLTGEFKDVYLGVVDVEDKDDWDLPNKTFTFLQRSTQRRFRYERHSTFQESICMRTMT